MAEVRRLSYDKTLAVSPSARGSVDVSKRAANGDEGLTPMVPFFSLFRFYSFQVPQTSPNKTPHSATLHV
jgi:hypothetical protein